MASIKLSGLISDIRGKLQGSYFASRNNTTILSSCTTKTTKADAGRVLLQLRRQAMRSVSQTWQTLTDAQKLAWQAEAALQTFYTKVGIGYTPTGYAWYSKCNLLLSSSLVANITSPNPSIPTLNVTDFGVDLSVSGVCTLTCLTSIPANEKLLVSVSYANTKGVSRPRGGYKNLAILDSTSIFPLDVTGNIDAVFGSMPTAGTMFFQFKGVANASGKATTTKTTKADAG